MKTSYFRRRSAFFSSSGRLVAAIAVVALVLVIGIRVIWPGSFFALAAPLFAFGNLIASVSENPEADTVRADRALTNENAALRSRITDLEQLLGTVPGESSGIVAGVIARPPMAPYDSLIIGAGQDAGVAFGMLVSADGGVPIGTVETVTRGHAQVALFSTAGRVTDGWIGEERLPISIQGLGAGAFTADIPRDADVGEGALVYVPGPGARPIGRVIRVDADPSSPSATVRIEPLANIFSLPLVLIEALP